MSPLLYVASVFGGAEKLEESGFPSSGHLLVYWFLLTVRQQQNAPVFIHSSIMVTSDKLEDAARAQRRSPFGVLFFPTCE